MNAPLLVFGWGNRSRGDDALGPMFVERLRERLGDDGVDYLDDYQLQVEHALDLAGRARVLLVDASLDAEAPFRVQAVEPRRDTSFTTHAVSPAALLAVFVELHRAEPPQTTLLAIRGERFELGEAPTPAALANLGAALDWAERWAATPTRRTS